MCRATAPSKIEVQRFAQTDSPPRTTPRRSDARSECVPNEHVPTERFSEHVRAHPSRTCPKHATTAFRTCADRMCSECLPTESFSWWSKRTPPKLWYPNVARPMSKNLGRQSAVLLHVPISMLPMLNMFIVCLFVLFFFVASEIFQKLRCANSSYWSQINSNGICSHSSSFAGSRFCLGMEELSIL